jgi:glycosyltransferase involved in cell wall biosynthesis
MQDKAVLYSVVIPTHARPELVRQAVRSGLVSKHASEVIIVEDRTQDAMNVASQLCSQEGKIRYLRKDTGPKGASATRNVGADAARGKFIVFLDDDDQFVPGYLEQLNQLLLQSPARWGFADQVHVSASGTETRPKKAIRRTNVFQRKIAAMSSGFWIERALFRSFGGLDPDLTVDEDTDLCCRLIGKGFDPNYRPIAAVRLNRNTSVKRLTNSTKQREIAKCYLTTYSKNIENCRSHRGAEAYLLLRAHRMLCRAGDMNSARELSAAAKRLDIRLAGKLTEIRFGFCSKIRQ